MIEIKGKYFPVGQGLTYGFKLDKYHILFDIANTKNIDKLLEDLESFYKDKSIDILTLSHFHYDHIRGVDKLFDAGFQCKEIFIPYVPLNKIIIMNLGYIYTIVKAKKISHYANKNTEKIDVNDILNHYKKLELDITKDLFFEKDLLKVISKYDKIINIRKVDNEIRETRGQVLWEFYYMNSECFNDSMIQRFYLELKKIGIVSALDLYTLQLKYKSIKNAYEKVFKYLNLTSMFLVHGPKEPDKIKETIFKGKVYSNKNSLPKSEDVNKYHSFISGDMYLNKDVNQKKLSSHTNKIKYALIPHHSSTVCWSDFLCKQNQHIVWIVTINKIGGRPYGRVVHDIYNNNQEIYICDKHEAFEYEFTL